MVRRMMYSSKWGSESWLRSAFSRPGLVKGGRPKSRLKQAAASEFCNYL